MRVQVVRDVLWYRGSKTEPVMVVLVVPAPGIRAKVGRVLSIPAGCRGGPRSQGGRRQYDLGMPLDELLNGNRLWAADVLRRHGALKLAAS